MSYSDSSAVFLPQNTILQIVALLDFKDLFSLYKVNKYYYNLLKQNDILWKKHITSKIIDGHPYRIMAIYDNKTFNNRTTLAKILKTTNLEVLAFLYQKEPTYYSESVLFDHLAYNKCYSANLIIWIYQKFDIPPYYQHSELVKKYSEDGNTNLIDYLFSKGEDLTEELMIYFLHYNQKMFSYIIRTYHYDKKRLLESYCNSGEIYDDHFKLMQELGFELDSSIFGYIRKPGRYQHQHTSHAIIWLLSNNIEPDLEAINRMIAHDIQPLKDILLKYYFYSSTLTKDKQRIIKMLKSEVR